MRLAILLACPLVLGAAPALAVYSFVKEYSGSSFFSDWDFGNGTYDRWTNGTLVMQCMSASNLTSFHRTCQLLDQAGCNVSEPYLHQQCGPRCCTGRRLFDRCVVQQAELGALIQTRHCRKTALRWIMVYRSVFNRTTSSPSGLSSSSTRRTSPMAVPYVPSHILVIRLYSASRE